MLSVCLIVKNEEKNLKRCLNSIKSIADEIIVVDTGSTDKTIEIAEQFNSKIIKIPWDNNFSQARNKSIEFAKYEWILFLDADEIIPNLDSYKLKDFIYKHKNYEAFYFRLSNYLNNREKNSSSVLRLFKNNKNYRFKGKIHENIIDSIKNLTKEDSIKYTDFKIIHYGYNLSLIDMKIKHKRNLNILLSYDESEKNSYYYYCLANQYASNNDSSIAIENYKKALKLADFYKNDNFNSYLVLNFMKSLFKEKKFYDLIIIYSKYKGYFDDFKDMHFVAALAFIELGKNSNALDCIKKYKSIDIENLKYCNSNFSQNYDIKNLIFQLKSGLIKKAKNLIKLSIIVTKKDFDIVQSVVNLNELADDIEVYNVNSKNPHLDNLPNYGINCVNILEDDLVSYKFKNKNNLWHIILYDTDVFSLGEQWLLAILLEDYKNYELISFDILNINNNSLSQEIRATKYKSISINQIKDLKDYASSSYINSHITIYTEDFKLW